MGWAGRGHQLGCGSVQNPEWILDSFTEERVTVFSFSDLRLLVPLSFYQGEGVAVKSL